MNKEIKEKWIAALRSGKYEQGRGYLNMDDKAYCCLGVLCEVLNVPKRPTRMGHYTYMKYDDYYTAVCPSTVKVQADMHDEQLYTLMQMNDSGCSFTEIADYIDQKL